MPVKDDCAYPDCFNCEKPDCNMEDNDIAAMLKRRRYAFDPELYRIKSRDYRAAMRADLPHCDECENCILVKNQKGNGYLRLCIDELRVIEQKVSNSPMWCKKRSG